jgi:hypothetical protein
MRNKKQKGRFFFFKKNGGSTVIVVELYINKSMGHICFYICLIQEQKCMAW